jgi:diguanylate cyclase (GGDEF)-like protein
VDQEPTKEEEIDFVDSAPAEIMQGEAKHLEKKCVLVLDDDSSFQDLVGSLLTAHGYEVWPARTAAEASSYLAVRQPSMLIVDYRLPVMDGITWISKLRESGNNLPILFVSGTWCDAKTFSWLRNILKVSLIFRKPIDPQLFLQAIEDLLPSESPAAIEHEKQESVQSRHSLNRIDFSKFLEKGNYEESLQKLDELVIAAGDDPLVLKELDQIRRKVRTHRAVHSARVQYITQIPGIWQDLVQLVVDAKNSANSNSNSSTADHSLTLLALEAAHKLKGTSGSYGLAHISEIAAELENFLKCIDPSCSKEEMSIYWAEIERLLDDGQRIIDTLTHVNLESTEGKEERPISLLLVSPQDTYRTLISHSINFNIDVHVVNSAAGAITRANSMPFDIAVIDLSLDPESTGLIASLTKNLRSIRQCQQMPFIFIADPTQYSNISALIYAGCAGLLEPPVSIEALDDSVRSLGDAFKHRKQRILCVDDDPMLTFFLSCVLGQDGFEVQALNEPIQILESLESFQPDLILLDVMMPGLSGYEVCRMLRAHKEWSHVPIIFLTVKNDIDTRSAAFQAGGNDFLGKPVVPEELLARVQAHLAKSKLEKHSDYDDVSGVLEWEHFQKQANRILKESNKNNTPASLAVIVVENYSQLDDRHGEYTKQQVLAEVGELLSLRFRTADVRGTLKSSAFAVVFKGESSATTSSAVTLLKEEIARSIFTRTSGEHFQVILNTAVADAGIDGLTLDSLVECAIQRLAVSDQLGNPAVITGDFRRFAL